MTCTTRTGRSSVATDLPRPWEPGETHDEVGPLSRTAALWVSRPEVLADPDQRDALGRVWTTADDILPGTVIVPGTRVVAAWGDVTFTARPRWDETAALVLWLEEPAPSVGRPKPSPEASLTTARPADPTRPSGDASPGHATKGEATSGDAQPSRSRRQDRGPVGSLHGQGSEHDAQPERTRDLCRGVVILAEAIARDRRAVREALAQLETLPEKPYRRLARHPAIQALYGIARQTPGRA